MFKNVFHLTRKKLYLNITCKMQYFSINSVNQIDLALGPRREIKLKYYFFFF